MCTLRVYIYSPQLGTCTCFGTLQFDCCCRALQKGMGLQEQNEALEVRGSAGGGQELESAQRVTAAERKVLYTASRCWSESRYISLCVVKLGSVVLARTSSTILVCHACTQAQIIRRCLYNHRSRDQVPRAGLEVICVTEWG